MLSATGIYAQWVNNPEVNTILLDEGVNPVNIISAEDNKGGVFIFWEDNRSGLRDEIYFLHIDGNGKVTFRVDGKRISDNDLEKSNPAAAPGGAGEAVVLWINSGKRDLFVQKVNEKGQLLWGNGGVRIANSSGEIVDYAVNTDKIGNTFVVYTEREEKKYNLRLQKLNSSGYLFFELNNLPVYVSNASKSMASVIADNDGGVFVLWLETLNNKSEITALHFDETGKSTWGKNPVNISGAPAMIATFSASLLNSSIYAAWQVHKADKNIYHQLINRNGKPEWGHGGEAATRKSGSQLNPQVLTSDSSVILSWTQDDEADRDVYVQKYSLSGETLWDPDGVCVVALARDQFGQKIVTDRKGGVIVSWIDRRDEGKFENIYAQRVSRKGMLVWDSLGIPVASHPGSEKSYLTVLSDSRGGIIAVFKDKRNGYSGIYGQKVFNTGTYISQIVGFQAETEGDSVHISWYSANETGLTTYEIERAASSDTSGGWEVVHNLISEGGTIASKYEFYDKPAETGTVYYRLIQTDEKGNIQPSDIIKVNYFAAVSDFTLAQNTPNPCADKTIIKFYLPRAMNVSIEFFDSHIEKIDEIKDHFSEGENEIVFNASALQQGVYFYRFEAGSYVDVKKMVVVK